MQMYFRLIDVDPKEAEGLFKLLDLDESGEVDYEEFLNGCLRLRGNAKAIDLVTVMIESRKLSKRWAKHARTVEEDLHSVQDMLEFIEDDLFHLTNQGHSHHHHRSSSCITRGSTAARSRRSASVRASIQDHLPENSRDSIERINENPDRQSSMARKSQASIRFTQAMQLSQEDIKGDEWPDLA